MAVDAAERPAAKPLQAQAPGRRTTHHWTSAVPPAWTLLSHPSWAAAMLEGAAAVAIASVVPLASWPRGSLVVFAVVIGLAVLNAGLRVFIGRRLPLWTLHVDLVLGALAVSAASWAAAKEQIQLANLYLLVAVFAALYMPLRSALAHIALCGAAYAVVLALAPRSGESAAAAWLAVFGTTTVTVMVVVGMLSVLRRAAGEDSLTGLAARRAWDERLEEELERARRSGGALSVLVIDLDDFKRVNDDHGHLAGDRLLQAVARSWRMAVRGGGDFLARLGGDEFAVLAPGSDARGARRLARRLERALPSGVAVSIGIATWNRAESAAELLRRADEDMYRVKRRRHPSKASPPTSPVVPPPAAVSGGR